MATLNYTWTAPDAGAPDSYNLYEGSTSGTETLLASVSGAVTSYSHAHGPGTFAAYVTAVAGATESAPTNEVSGTVAAGTGLQPPILAAAVQVSGGVPSVVLQCTVPGP